MKNYERYYINDEPIDFYGLTIYPVQMKNYLDFMLTSNILNIDKNSLDIRYISMNYLGFLIDRINSQDENGDISIFLYRLFSIILREDEFDFKYHYDSENVSQSFLTIKGVKIDSKIFEELKEVLSEQNLMNKKNNKILDTDLQKDLEEERRLRNKGKSFVSIEKQMIFFMAETSLTYEYILDMSIRKFFIALEMIDKKLHYTIRMTSAMSGFCSFKKNEIVHYLTETETKPVDEVIDYDSFVNKIKHV